MRKRSGNIWLSASRNFKKIFIFVALIVFLALFYYWAIEPILVRFIIPTTSIHEGIELFSNQQYLEFDSGFRFQSVIQNIDYLVYGTGVDFYHVDNHLRDNPIYGEMCDIFALDVKLESPEYLMFREEIMNNCTDSCKMDDFQLYVWNDESTANGEVTLLALCDQSCIIRVIMLTDAEKELSAINYSTILIMQSSLNWIVNP